MQADFIDNLLRSLSWTFIHSLWQGLILTILAGIVMCCTGRSASAKRYGLLALLFFLFLAGVGSTFIIEWNTGTINSPGLLMLKNLPDSDLLFSHSIFGEIYSTLLAFINSHSQWIVSTWLVVLCFKSFRIVIDLLYVYRLRSRNLISPSSEWQIKFQSVCDQLGIGKRVTLMESAIIKIPAVIGYFKPVVLVPVGILAQLPPGEVESILLHELAHIRRHDYLVNFIQRVAEILFFFNPGLLWVSSLLKIERENCCDDLVVSRTGNKAEYLNAIISFKEFFMKQQGYVLGLFGNQNLLLQRMKRLVYQKNRVLSSVERGFFIMNIVIFVLIFSAMQKPELTHQDDEKSAGIVQEALPSFPLYLTTDGQKIFIPGNKAASSETNLQFRNGVRNRDEGKRVFQQPTVADNQKSRNKNILPNQEHSHDIGLLSELLLQKNHVLHASTNEHLKQMIKDRFQGEDTKYDEAVETTGNQSDNELLQLKILGLQADWDRAQADEDRQQAQIDRLLAAKDRQQAEIDRVIAARDRAQADIDRLQAEKDSENAQRDRLRQEKEKSRSEKMKVSI